MHAKCQGRKCRPARIVFDARCLMWGWIIAAASGGGKQAAALTPAGDALAFQEKAAQIARIETRQVHFPDPTGLRSAENWVDVSVVAVDKQGQVVPLTEAEANAFFAPRIQNPVQGTVAEIAGPERFVPGTVNGTPVNYVRIQYGAAKGSARLEVAVRPEYQGIIAAQPAKMLLSTAFWPKVGNAIITHPYVSAGVVGAAVVGGVTLASVADGGGGGGDGGGGGGSTGGSLAGILNGSWSGSVSGMQLMETPERGSIGGRFKMFISVSGHVSGNYSGDYSGSISGSVSSSGQLSVSAGGGAGLARWSGTIRRSGSKLYGSGTWSASMGSGRWSGSGVSSAP